MNKNEITSISKMIADICRSESIDKCPITNLHTVTKKSNDELVTNIDMNIQKNLFEQISQLYPNSIFLSEEADNKDVAQLLELSFSQPLWIIDPLDGTNNLIKGIPNYTTAMALIENGIVEASWIHAPVLNETACAKRGSGAWIAETNEPLIVKSSNNQKKKIDLNSNVEALFKDNFEILKTHSRSFTYMALAKNMLDAAIFTKQLQPWDHLPGTFIFNEAGGHHGMISGNPYSINDDSRILLMASNKEEWQVLQDTLLPHVEKITTGKPRI